MLVEFERPDLLYLLLLLPLWGLLVWPRVGRGVLFARGESARLLQGRWAARSGILLVLPRLLMAVTMACVIVALAGPQRVEVARAISQEGKGIVLAVDLSTSMLAEDMDGESRLDVARRAAIRFAERRPFDELTLVGFAGQAFTRVPPTSDPNLIVAGVKSLQVELVRNGTDISGAILTSIHRLLESEREARIIVLLTDGAHNAAGVLPLTTARAAATMGVRIYSISLVSPGEASGTMRPVGGQNQNSTEVETVLSGVSALTGGRYFQAGSAAALDSIYLEIDRIEAPILGLMELEMRQPKRVWFLASALFLMGVTGVLRGSRWGVVP